VCGDLWLCRGGAGTELSETLPSRGSSLLYGMLKVSFRLNLSFTPKF
jgi:hypothetical protein